MTTKNSLLLIIKQNPGTDYISLVNKTSQNYGSINSARAALSRALKDLSAFGFVERRNNAFFLTEKGNLEINTQMKSKLLLRLNESIKSRNNLEEIDTIVKHLHTLIERSKADADLLKAARNSADFYIAELHDLLQKLQSKTEHFSYLQRVLAEQLETLKQFNFNDSCRMDFNEENFSKSIEFSKSQSTDSFVVETRNSQLLESIANATSTKPNANNLLLPIAEFKRVSDIIKQCLSSQSIQQEAVALHFGAAKIEFLLPNIMIYGPYATINEFAGKGKK